VRAIKINFIAIISAGTACSMINANELDVIVMADSQNILLWVMANTYG